MAAVRRGVLARYGACRITWLAHGQELARAVVFDYRPRREPASPDRLTLVVPGCGRSGCSCAPSRLETEKLRRIAGQKRGLLRNVRSTKARLSGHS
jgi:hypothetical protein